MTINFSTQENVIWHRQKKEESTDTGCVYQIGSDVLETSKNIRIDGDKRAVLFKDEL